MPASYLHGVETIDILDGARPIRVVKTATIALVGIAPTGAKNVLKLVNSPKDAEQFGSQLTGFTIPQALAAIFAQGAGTVVVVNVFDSEDHVAAVTSEPHTVADGKVKSTYAPVNGVVVKNNDATVTYVLDEDYTFDAYGNFTIINREDIADGAVIKITYNKLDLTAVTDAHINGTITDGVRTGAKLFEETYNTFGFRPFIYIAPGFTTRAAVATNLISIVDTAGKGHCIIDAPAATTVEEAIAGRGPAGAINFYTSNKRALLCYPMLKAYSPQTEGDVLQPYSQFLAGVIAATDYNLGYWYSPSNKEIKGITGQELVITSGITDATSDANALNEVGIITLFGSFGTGTRTWGNRSAAWPASTDPVNFISVLRVADIVQESIELSMLQFIDLPLNNAVIDSIVASVNAFMRTLIGRGALIQGSECFYDPAKNSAEELALGHVVFTIVEMAPTPGERITFDRKIDINLLKNLG